jgi:hypothetical protein
MAMGLIIAREAKVVSNAKAATLDISKRLWAVPCLSRVKLRVNEDSTKSRENKRYLPGFDNR